MMQASCWKYCFSHICVHQALHAYRSFILAWEDGVSGVELGEDATQAPHIDGHMVVHAKNDFRRSC